MRLNRVLAIPLLVGAVAGALVVGSSGGGAGRLPLVAPGPAFPGPLLGFVYGSSSVRLAPIDGRTLRPRAGRSRRLPGAIGWAASPDRARLAIASCDGGRAGRPCSWQLRLLAMPAMRPLGPPVPFGSELFASQVAALAWAGNSRLVALAGNCYPCPGGAEIVHVDPATGTVTDRFPIDGTVVRVARARAGLVLLTGPENAIGPATLVVADGHGPRTIPLDRIAAGLIPNRKNAISTDRFPALAVDSAGRTAFVVDPDGTVAEVRLASLSVSYHRPRVTRSLFARLDGWLEPSAQAKGDSGPWRQAQWLGDGLLAVSGTDLHTVAARRGTVVSERLTERPAGLEIVDTRRWTVHMLDPEASAFTIADGLLLATGARWDVTPTENRMSGEGLVAYDADGKRRFQLLAGRAVSVDRAYAGRAYVTVSDRSGHVSEQVVDLRTGERRVLGIRAHEWPQPLLGDGSPTGS